MNSFVKIGHLNRLRPPLCRGAGYLWGAQVLVPGLLRADIIIIFLSITLIVIIILNINVVVVVSADVP